MIYLNQNKLSRLCINMNNADKNYLYSIQSGIKDIANWFNTYWISNLSKRIADTIHNDLENYHKEISEIFYQLNKKVKKEVKIYNENPENQQKLFYKGFSISKPNINQLINLNDTLPDGKIGSLNTKTNMDYPIIKLKIIIEESSVILKSAVTKSEALSNSEIDNIQYKIISSEKKLINSLEQILEIIRDKEN